jgi:hypothetical protein
MPSSFDRVVLKYCATGLHQMVYAEAVKIVVERFLVNYANRHNADWLLEDYDKLIRLVQLEHVPYPSETDVSTARSFIRHAADVPVLLSAMRPRPTGCSPIIPSISPPRLPHVLVCA